MTGADWAEGPRGAQYRGRRAWRATEEGTMMLLREAQRVQSLVADQDQIEETL